MKNDKKDPLAVHRAQLLARTLHTMEVPWSEVKPETTVINVIKLHYC